MEVTHDLLYPPRIVSKEHRVETDKMRNALTSIASEMRRFQESTLQSELPAVAPTQKIDDEKIFSELVTCKSKIQSKRAKILKLRCNLKTACFVAKTLASAKENESVTLHNRLSVARSECDDLIEKYKSNIDIINSLSRDNEILHHKLENIANIIQLGYKELQKIRHDEPLEEGSVLIQLRKLILCCGEYYADYCNEHEKYLQIKQRNRFLNNKIIILENHIEAISEQLKTLKYCKDRLQKENASMRERYSECMPLKNLEVAYSEIKINSKISKENSSKTDLVKQFKERESGDSELKQFTKNEFDLSSHLVIVKSLLSDQDTLLKDLRIISHEFSSF